MQNNPFNGYPLNGSRKDRLDFIKSEKSKGNYQSAWRFYLLNPKGISRRTFDNL
jgi:hypothetical protein